MTSLDASYAHAGSISRRQARNFHYAFIFLPRVRRRSLHAVYAYSRRLDDAVDSVEERGVDVDAARSELDFLESFLSDRPPDDPLVPALRDTIERFAIPRALFGELIAGMRMDLVRRRYATFEDLYLYCYRVASAVGLVCMEIFGYDGPVAHKPAEELGIAMQLTNILRDVPEDLERGRIYIPAEDFERFGYGESELTHRVLDDRFRSLMGFQAVRARDYFRRAEALYPLVHAESRYCPMLLGRLYGAILDRIEACRYDVFSSRPRLGAARKLRLAAATWLASRARSPRPRR